MGIGLLLMAACAQVVSPTGGEKDTQPPRFVKANPPLGDTNVQPAQIRIFFDEFIKVQNQRKNILFSPPLTNYEVIRRKRSVEIVLPEDSLKTNTTHTIQFGKAIRDLTEGNAATGFVYVFSTGNKVDSLNLKGRVVDAFTRDSVQDASVLLYRDTAPTAIKSQRPYFYTEANEAGRFAFQYLKTGTYKLYALKDLNNNLQYDPGERVGLLSETLTLSGDSALTPVPLFKQFNEPAHVVKKENPYRGKLNLTFSQPVDTFQVEKSEANDVLWHLGEDPNKGEVFFRPSAKDTLQFYLKLNQTVRDTVTLKRSSGFTERLMVDTNFQLSFAEGSVRPDSPIRLKANHPIRDVQDTAIQVYRDSTSITGIRAKVRGASRKQIAIQGPFQADSAYRVMADPGSAVDWYGNLNDSAQQTFKVLSQNDLSKVSLNIKAPRMDSGQVLINLLNSDNRKVRKAVIRDTSQEVVFSALRKGNYQIKAIVDRNGNGFWDRGNLFEEIQPELVIFYPKTLSLEPGIDLLGLNFNIAQKRSAPDSP